MATGASGKKVGELMHLVRVRAVAQTLQIVA